MEGGTSALFSEISSKQLLSPHAPGAQTPLARLTSSPRLAGEAAPRRGRCGREAACGSPSPPKGVALLPAPAVRLGPRRPAPEREAPLADLSNPGPSPSTPGPTGRAACPCRPAEAPSASRAEPPGPSACRPLRSLPRSPRPGTAPAGDLELRGALPATGRPLPTRTK